MVPRLGTGARYNVLRFHGGHAVVRPPVVCSRLVLGCPFYLKFLIAKRGGPTENWFCIDLVAIYEFGTYREFSVATENASLAR